jgi:hypothetical protein
MLFVAGDISIKKIKKGLKIQCGRCIAVNKENLLLPYGCEKYSYIAPVIVPNDVNGKQMWGDIFGKTNLGDKVIIGEAYYLYNVQTAHKFKLPISEDYIRCIIKYGTIEDFNWLYEKGFLANYNPDECVINYASSEGHIHVLEWLKNSRLPLKYSEFSLLNASKNNHVKVLEWWKQSGLELKYDDKGIIDKAYYSCACESLKWWYESNLPLKYTKKQLKQLIDKCEKNIYSRDIDV